MQASLATTLSSLPHSPHVTPLFYFSHRAVTRPTTGDLCCCRALAPNNRKSSSSSSAPVGPPGFVSAIEKAMGKEEEYRKARAQVERKGVDVEGYIVEGASIGGHETCDIVPCLNSVFDIGRCRSRAVNQDNLFITHAHIDHIGGLPMYVSTRGLYSLKPRTIFVPPCIKADVEKLFEVHRSMSKDELKHELVALDVGETYEIRNDLVVRPFRTQHDIPSQGYVIYSVRKKLKKQYAHLEGPQIRKLKVRGVEITDTILSPELAFTGDTMSDFILEPRNADSLRAKVLITEATFLDEDCDIEQAGERGHMHLFEIMEHAQWFRNKAILLTSHPVTNLRISVELYQSCRNSCPQRSYLLQKASNLHTPETIWYYKHIMIV